MNSCVFCCPRCRFFSNSNSKMLSKQFIFPCSNKIVCKLGIDQSHRPHITHQPTYLPTDLLIYLPLSVTYYQKEICQELRHPHLSASILVLLPSINRKIQHFMIAKNKHNSKENKTNTVTKPVLIFLHSASSIYEIFPCFKYRLKVSTQYFLVVHV